MRGKKLFIASLALSTAVTAGLCGLSYANDSEANAASPIGRVTAAFGHTSIRNENGSRACDLQALVNNDDRIVTNGGGISVLLASRVVLKLDASTCVSVREALGDTVITLEYGTVHVFVGQRPADYGKVILIDPQSRLETTDGVFLASYDPNTRESYAACEQKALMLKCDGQDMPLPAQEQVIVRQGKLASNGSIDPLAFMDRKRSFDQLGQSVMQQGANTFRLRTRAFDTEVAISQLSAAGWIDRQALIQAQTNQPQSAEQQQEEQTSNESTESPSKKPSKKPAKSDSNTNNEPAPTNDTTVVVTPNTPVETGNNGSSTPARPVNDPSVAQNPTPTDVTPSVPNTPGAGETPVTQVPVESNPSRPAPPVTPSAPSTPPSTIDLTPSIAPSTPVVVIPSDITPNGSLGGASAGGGGVADAGGAPLIPADVPVVDVGDNGNNSSNTRDSGKSGKGNGNRGKGNSNKNGGGTAITKNNGGTRGGGGGVNSGAGSLPTIDLNVGGNGSPGGIAQSGGGSSSTLGLTPKSGGASPSGVSTPVNNSAPAPKINIDLPKVGDVTGGGASVPKADIGITPPVATNAGGGGTAAPPVVPANDAPVLPPKIDLNVNLPTPKVDATPALNIPKMDAGAGVVPKVDVTPDTGGALPKVEGVVPNTQTPIVSPGDLNISPPKDVGVVPPGTEGATPPALPSPTEAGATPPAGAPDTATATPPVAPEVAAPQRQDAAEKPVKGKRGKRKKS